MKPKLKKNEEFADWFEQWLAKIQRNLVRVERETSREEDQRSERLSARTDFQELGRGHPGHCSPNKKCA
jgi:hypothetical protein